MDLIRLDSNPNPNPDEYPNNHRQNEDEREQEEGSDAGCEDSKLRVKFKRFGLGEQRRSNFVVEIDWLDVKSFVRHFIEMGHREALHLQRVLRLVEAIEGAGWNPDDPPYGEFWEIVPPNSN